MKGRIKMKMRKILSVVLALAMTLSIASCAKTKTAGIGTNISAEAKQAIKEGKIVVSIPKWPEEGAPGYEDREKSRIEFMEQNPDIFIERNTSSFNFQTFTAIAAAGELPTMFDTYYTQVNSIINDGFAADITKPLADIGFLDYINEDLLAYTTDKDGKVYALTNNAYNQGLHINKKIFKEAGLVDAAGNVLIPKTYEEVYEFSKVIKEKTGKAGFVFPTSENAGGWHFINVAWAYGVDFLKKEDGKYTALFNTQECYDAFEWIRKMKAEELFPTSATTISQSKLYELFGTNQAAMMIADPPCNALTVSYGMDPKDIAVAAMPAGPAGAFSQLGGDVYMFRSDATPEQIAACLKWLEFRGLTPEIDDAKMKKLEEDNQAAVEMNGIVLPKPALSIWESPERDALVEKINMKHVNVIPTDYASYYAGEGLTIKPEPEAACQELYTILDGVIQAIYADTNVDIPALVKEAEYKWQVNYLNKIEY